MRSNCKQVKDAIRAHILEYYTAEELFEQVEYIKKYAIAYPTNYRAVIHMVEGGLFMVYNEDIAAFLNELGINPTNKEYDPLDSFKLYCHLIARDSELILKHVNK